MSAVNRPAGEGEIRHQIGVLLRQARSRAGWSLHDVEARTSGVWKAVVIGSYERGDRAVTAANLVALAAVYSVPVVSLLPAGENDDVQARAIVLEELADELRQRAAVLRDDETPKPVDLQAAPAMHIAEGPGS